MTAFAALNTAQMRGAGSWFADEFVAGQALHFGAITGE